MTLCIGAELIIEGHGQVRERDLRHLHAAVTVATGLGHDTSTPPTPSGIHHRRQGWALRPWPCASGVALVLWAHSEGAVERLRGGVSARIGRKPVRLRIGALHRVHEPLGTDAEVSVVDLIATTPVCVRRTQRRVEGQPVHRVVYHTTPTAESIASGLRTLAVKLGVAHDDIHVTMLSSRTLPQTVALGGKLGGRHGWVGVVRLEASRQARWLLDAAARGLGMGASTSYGLGAVSVRQVASGPQVVSAIDERRSLK